MLFITSDPYPLSQDNERGAPQ